MSVSPENSVPARASAPDRPFARWLAGSRLVRRLRRRLVWSRLTLELLEEGRHAAACHQLRWARALEEGSALSLFVSTPKGMEPENFAEHFRHCRCVYWRWFLEQGIAGDIRTVLDVGCGHGFAGEHFVRQGFDVTGITGNPDEQRESERRGIRVAAEDFHFLRRPDESFDLVFSSHSLEHSVSPLFALLEWARLVRPGGYLMIVLPMAVEGDVRAAFRAHYDPAGDTLDFAATAGEVFSADHILTACYTYGIPPHIFVLAYGQLAWLFRLAGLELLAGGAEDTIGGCPAGLEQIDGRLPRDPRRALNGLFLLRKPARGRA